MPYLYTEQIDLALDNAVGRQPVALQVRGAFLLLKIALAAGVVKSEGELFTKYVGLCRIKSD